MKYLLFFIFSFAYFTCFTQPNVFHLSISSGMNISVVSLGEVNNNDFNEYPIRGTSQESTLGTGWALRTEVHYNASKKISLFTGFRLSKFHYEHIINTSYRFTDTGAALIKSPVQYIGLGIPLGAKIEIGTNFYLQATTTYYQNLPSTVEGQLVSVIESIDIGSPLGKGEHHSIAKKNVAVEIGLLFHPSMFFKKINKHFFVLLSAEYFFKPDIVYFSDSKAKKLTGNLLIGFKI